jgi:hypothetical protein
VSDTYRQAEAVMETASEAIKKAYSDPARLAEFIEGLQTPVYVLRLGVFSRIVLWALGFEPGFIPPSESGRYKLLQGILRLQSRWPGIRPAAAPDTPTAFRHGVFVLFPALFSMSFLSYQLHHWLACRSGLHGYDGRAQALYRKFWNDQHGHLLSADVETMSEEDILALKAAINRDLEALCFLRRMMQDVIIPATQGQRFSTEGNASI